MKKNKNLILLKELVSTDFKLRYQGSVLGYLWSVVKPLMLFTIMYFVFVRFLRFGGDMPHFSVALLLGMVLWNFFAESTMLGMTSIVSYGGLLRKVNIPKTIIVTSSTMNSVINLLINLIVVVIFALINGVSLTWRVAFLPFLLVELFILAYGLALLMSAIYVRFRDLGQIWEVVLQGAMYATPIIYPITMIIDRGYTTIAQLMMLNPMAQIIQDARYLTISPENLTIWQLVDNKFLALIPYLLPFAIFLLGRWYFNKQSDYFAEVV
ncbi:ABC transporter permease [Streptococcaceae bacterium ESL0729]|nr:ABC transporter permease [Streptococcaceae bacterium ESL0729]